MILGRQPVAIAALVAIAINLFVSFGLKLTVEQIALINALAIGVLNLVASQQVTPTSAPVLTAGTTVSVVTPAGQPNGSGTLNVTPAGVATIEPA